MPRTYARRTEYGEVRLGTKRAEILSLLMRPEGLGGRETMARGLATTFNDLRSTIHRLEDDFGYDVRRIRKVYPRGLGAPEHIYRVVARFHKNGSLWHDYLRVTLEGN